MGRTVVVTGAAGLVGSHLCEAFAREGYTVRAIDRPGSDLAAALQAGALALEAELDRPDGALALAEAARDAALVVHAAFPGGDQREAALAAVRAAIAAALNTRAPLLLLSSCSVYGRPRNLPCEEGDPKEPTDAHGETRWAVEREAFLARRTRGLRLAVLRPALTYGPRQRRGLAVALAAAAVAAREDRPLWVPRRGPVLHTVHAQDVARAALLLAPRIDELDGRAFNVADDVPLPLEELARAVLEAAGAREAGHLPYSPGPTRALLWIARKLPDWMLWRPANRRLARAWRRAWDDRPPVAPPRLEPDLLEQLTADRWYDTQRLRALGFTPRFPSPVEGLLELAGAQRSRGLLPAATPAR